MASDVRMETLTALENEGSHTITIVRLLHARTLVVRIYRLHLQLCPHLATPLQACLCINERHQSMAALPCRVSTVCCGFVTGIWRWFGVGNEFLLFAYCVK